LGQRGGYSTQKINEYILGSRGPPTGGKGASEKPHAPCKSVGEKRVSAPSQGPIGTARKGERDFTVKKTGLNIPREVQQHLRKPGIERSHRTGKTFTQERRQ